MNETQVNIPLLRKAVEWAEVEAARPNGSWDQGSVAYATEQTHCGTAFCIAGWTLYEALGMTVEQIAADHGALDKAAGLLGIPLWSDSLQDDHLFDGHNSIAEIRMMAEDIAGERL